MISEHFHMDLYYKTNNKEEDTLQNHRCENLKSYNNNDIYKYRYN
jgi:hypothetical protein